MFDFFAARNAPPAVRSGEAGGHGIAPIIFPLRRDEKDNVEIVLIKTAVLG